MGIKQFHFLLSSKHYFYSSTFLSTINLPAPYIPIAKARGFTAFFDKMPSGWIHSEIIRLIFRILDSFVSAHQLGDVYQKSIFIFPHPDRKSWLQGSRIPDVMFYMGKRVRDFIRTTPDKNLPLALVPDLVIEVLSPTDTFSQIDEKIRFDLRNGVQTVWLIDPNRRKAWIYTTNADNSQVIGADGVLISENLLPNFKLNLADLWQVITD